MSGLAAALVAAASQSPPAAAASPSPDGGTPDAGADEELLREIEAATAPVTPTHQPEQKPETTAAAKAPVGGAFSNAFNPAMSVNGLFLGAFTSLDNPRDDQAHSGVAIQEVELQVLSNVDPY